MVKVFIDGKSGTTGLKIFERFSKRNDIELLEISEELRKDPTEKQKISINDNIDRDVFTSINAVKIE